MATTSIVAPGRRAVRERRSSAAIGRANPLTYVSEGARAAIGSGEHLATWAIPTGILGSIVVFGTIGLLGFRRRAID
jgi:ABC-type polysaccharide/polyol phosphate export permease